MSVEILEINQEQCELLADKIYSGEILTTSEKEFICNLLTNEFLTGKKRGRKSTAFRDRALAVDFEILKSEGLANKDIIPILGEKYELQGRKDVPERTFYKALERGNAFLAAYRLFRDNVEKRKNNKK